MENIYVADWESESHLESRHFDTIRQNDELFLSLNFESVFYRDIEKWIDVDSKFILSIYQTHNECHSSIIARYTKGNLYTSEYTH